jgi:6-phosphogluconolactonase
MRLVKAASLTLVLLIVAGLSLTGCSTHCGKNFSSSGGSSSGGGVSRSSVCGPVGGSGGGGISAGNAAALVYYLPFSLNAAAVASNGTISSLSGFTSPTLSGSGADDMIIVNKKFLYIPQATSQMVEGFVINRSTGALTAIAGSPFTLNFPTDTIASDPQGRFLFVGDEFGNEIASFLIDPNTGALTPSPGSPLILVPGVFSVDVMTVDGNGKFLYIGEQSASGPVHAFAIDQTTGALTAVTGSPFAFTIATPHADSTGKFLVGIPGYVDEGTSSINLIHVFSIDPSTGVPTEVPLSPFATANAPLEFAIHPSGKFVYVMEVSGSGAAAMEGFQMDATTGALTPLAGSPFTTLPTTLQCKFDQSGNEMVCATDFFTGSFVGFNVDPNTGALTNTGQPFAGGSIPFAVTD